MEQEKQPFQEVTSGGLDFAFRSAHSFPGGPGLFPCFFLGIEIEYHPTAKSPSVFFDSSAIQPRLMRPGQFYLYHQYASHSCTPISLFGALFPLHSCSIPAVVAGLGQFAAKYSYTDSPSLAKPEAIARMREELLKIGPFHTSQNITLRREIAEAFVRLASAHDILSWIKQAGLQHIVGIREYTPAEVSTARQRALSRVPVLSEEEANALANRWMLSDTDPEFRKKWARDRQIRSYYNTHPEHESEAMRFAIRTQLSPWRDIEDFGEWLTGEQDALIPREAIFAAFIYENCD